MKIRVLALLLVGCLLLGGCAQTGAGSARMADDLAVLALNQAADVFALAEDEAFLQAYTSSPSIRELMKEIAATDPAALELGYTLRLEGSAKDALRALLQGQGDDTAMLDELSPLTVKKLENSILAMLPNMINGSYSGSETLVASSVLQSGLACQKPENYPGNCSVILVFPNSWATFTSYVEGEENTLTASTILLRMDEEWMSAARSGELLASVTELIPVNGLALDPLEESRLAAAVKALETA